ncbi:unnamed protein product, partial [Ceratitis capitata]
MTVKQSQSLSNNKISSVKQLLAVNWQNHFQLHFLIDQRSICDQRLSACTPAAGGGTDMRQSN